MDPLGTGAFTVQQQGGILAAGLAVGAEQRAQPLALVDGAGRGEGQGTAGADRGAGAAADTQKRLDDDTAALAAGQGRGGSRLGRPAHAAAGLAFERGIAADGLGRTDIDAGGAADLLVAAVRTQLGLVVEELRLLELADTLTQLQHRGSQLDRVGTDMEVALRGLVHREGRRAAHVEHQIEGLGRGLRRALEVDRPGGIAGRDAGPVALAAGQVDAVAEVDGALGADRDAGIAARAQVQIDRVVAGPGGFEGTQPAGQLGQPTAVNGAIMALRQGAAVALDQQTDRQLAAEHRGGLLGRRGATDNQAASAAAVGHRRHRVGWRQLRGGDQGGQLGGRALGIF